MPEKLPPDRPRLAVEDRLSQLRDGCRAGDLVARTRVRAWNPKLAAMSDEAFADYRLITGEIQRAVAGQFGFRSWAQLEQELQAVEYLAGQTEHPRFAEAVARFDAGDLDGLLALLKEAPELILARAYLSPDYEHRYFRGATLLHHVAGNPIRCPLPDNVTDLARLLVNAGSDVNAVTLHPNGGSTANLVLTSYPAAAMGIGDILLDILAEGGAEIERDTPESLRLPLANGGARTAAQLATAGTPLDLAAAAGLGHMDFLRAAFAADGTLSKEAYGGSLLRPPPAETVGLALLFAYVNAQREAVEFLLDHGPDLNVTGVNNGTILHRACGAGDLALIPRLLAGGADIRLRDPYFHASPFSWADHQGHSETVRWLFANAPVDLHDAVCLGSPEQAAEVLAREPEALNRRIHQWDLPFGAPLHWAVRTRKPLTVRLLLKAGADPDLLDGNGRSPRDLAAAGTDPQLKGLLGLH